MIAKETVLSGAEHPGTELLILSSPAGYYIGFLCKDGMPYSRESRYFEHFEDAETLLEFLRT